MSTGSRQSSSKCQNKLGMRMIGVILAGWVMASAAILPPLFEYEPPTGSSSSSGTCGGADAVMVFDSWYVTQAECQDLCSDSALCVAFSYESYLRKRNEPDANRCRLYSGTVLEVLPQPHTAVCLSKVSVSNAAPACGAEPRNVCDGVFCFWDPRCSTPKDDPLEGAHCNAAGLHQNCRFCDISRTGLVPCPDETLATLPDLPGQTADKLDRLNNLFKGKGLLLHGLSLDYDFAFYQEHFLESLSLEEVPLHLDCGPYCSAFTHLQAKNALVTFAFGNLTMHGGVLYNAEEVWPHVQCLSVTDKTTLSRVCCACGDDSQCPFFDFPFTLTSEYCQLPCPKDDSVCRQLAAGCGVSVFDAVDALHDAVWGPQTCSREEIATGMCDLCMQPMWCHDPSPFGWAGAIESSIEWMHEFAGNDGDARALGIRQCVWKPNQLGKFQESVAALHQAYQAGSIAPGEHNLWNEVNVYADPDDHEQQRAFARAIAGFVVFRNLGFGKDDVNKYRQMKQHLATLGVDVPIYQVTVEAEGSIELWTPGQQVEILQDPYSLEVIW
mmetsp:Transcript_17218/g.36450  ORF Transcript_17218/g.36450 Transcript_17218/m.36450 type:complete len:553 (-) Transcript_17218:142-1800(-)